MTTTSPLAGSDRKKKSPVESFSLVGIGASAGGLEALTTLLENLPADIGSAFIIIQHLDPNHDSLLADILARSARMPVSQVKDGMRVEPNQIYVIPPNAFMSLEGALLRLEPRPEAVRFYMPVDHFFRSLARNHGSRAMGIILSGTGSDGTLGMGEIKDNGGITFAQDEVTARFAGMPNSAVAGGSVDFVMAVKDIAREIVRLARHPYVTAPLPADKEETSSPPPAPQEPLGQIFGLLRTAMGVDFTQYKSTTTLRRITRRMTLRKMDRLEDYVLELKENHGEVQALYHDLLIKVTNFFRDPESFESLQRIVIPALLKNRASGERSPIRIWVPGCASGEEAYSIAICFLESLGERAGDVPLRIFATDVDETALQKARAGSYVENISADVSPERLRSFFSKNGPNYQINKTIVDLCTFARHDLGKDPPFSNLDLISCRNVLIYFDTPMQKRVLTAFHYGLNPKGFLSLGLSENVGTSSELFTVIDKKQNIFAGKLGSDPVHPQEFMPWTPRTKAGKTVRSSEPWGEARRSEFDVYKEADRLLLNHYGPASVLVNEQMDILQFRGDTGRYLLQSPGKASLNLLMMAREGLFGQIKPAVDLAKKSGTVVTRKGVRVRFGGKSLDLTLKVIPLKFSGAAPHFIVLFEELPSPRQAKNKKKTPGRREADQQSGLRQELAATKEHLQSTIEGQDITLEELKVANEEILSSNEELQSTNEELETAKEELQSMNEELSTANEGMRQQNLAISQANNDLNNLFSSASLPMLLVGSDLRIRRFTRLVEKVLSIIPTDVGRPLKDFQFNLHLPNLEVLLSEVITTGVFKEWEVQDLKGHWYSIRIQPYRTDEGKAEGAVLTFIDIDSFKGVEKLTKSLEELQAARNYSEGIVQTVREPFLALDVDLRVISANPAFYRAFQTTKEETEGRFIYSLGNGQWEIPQLRTSLDQVLSASAELENFEVKQDFPGIGQKVMVLNAKRIVLDGAGTKMILLAIEDITDRRRAETQINAALTEKEVLLREIHHRVKNNLQIMSSLLKLRYDVVEDGTTRAFIQESLNRIQTIALVHEKLYNSENLAQINMKNYIQSLIEPLLLSWGKSDKIDLNIHAEGFFLGPDAAIPCGLIINELISNTLKHAFPEGRKGSVSIDLRMESGDQVFLGFRDDGIGIPEALDVSKATSLGLRLVLQLVNQLGGHLDMDRSSGGTVFAIRFPFHPEGDGADDSRSS
jgi:two-component system CheB/CheR fusion protein